MPFDTAATLKAIKAFALGLPEVAAKPRAKSTPRR